VNGRDDVTPDQSKDELRGQIEALHALQRALGTPGEGHHGALSRLAQMARRALDVDRVSVWRLVDEGQALELETSAAETGDGAPENADGDERPGAGDPAALTRRIHRSEAPGYFRSLDGDRAFAIDDVTTDPRTRELARSYFAEAEVRATLDVPILGPSGCLGVICHEDAAPRAWTLADEALGTAVADFGATILAAEGQLAAEQRLRAREEQLAHALAAARMGVWELDLEQDKVVWSDEVGPMVGRARGWSPDLPSYLAMVHPDDRRQLEQDIARAVSGPPGAYLTRHRVRHVDGSYRWLEGRGQVAFDASGHPTSLLGTVADVEHLRRLEEELRHAQKMEGIGRLAGGIAHDFNNLLTAAGFSLSELSKNLLPESRAARHARDVEDALARAAQLTSQLLAFARKQPRRPQTVDLGAAVQRAASLLRRVIGEDVALDLELPKGPGPWVRIDPGQLEQVLVNLAVNARDAMPRGGRLLVRMKGHGGNADASAPGAGVLAEVEVVDDGVGIAPDLLPKVREPFFTTKPAGAGTGLGLSTCVDIVREAGGELDLESLVGEGTTVCVRLPRVGAAGATPVPTPGRPAPEEDGTGAGRRVLLVEDEQLIRRAVVRTLERAGYEVLAADCGETALELAEAEAPGSIAIIVSDVVLPGLRGKPLVDALRARHPDAAVLFVSGYADDVARRELGSQDVEFLAKPFGPRDLTKKLSGLLG